MSVALDTLPDMRTFSHGSTLTDGGLALDLAPALTPAGLVDHPGFFHGFATHPVVVTRSLLVLADIAATRYFRPTPAGMRDPILTANGDRLRAECFSACNGVLARLDLLASGLDGGQIDHGTTNVDIGPAMRRALARVPRGELLHLDVGTDRLRASTPAESVEERRVQMPDSWVRALGNAAELTQPPGRALQRRCRRCTPLRAGTPPLRRDAHGSGVAERRTGAADDKDPPHARRSPAAGHPSPRRRRPAAGQPGGPDRLRPRRRRRRHRAGVRPARRPPHAHAHRRALPRILR